MKKKVLKKKVGKNLVSTLLILVCAVSLSFAKTYYVKPTGNDANNGTSETTAWQHVQKACATLVAGDTVLIRAGTYAEYGSWGADCGTEMPTGGCGTLTPKNSGISSSARITYKGYPGERPIISGACGGTDYNCSAVNIGASHIVLDSLIITKSWHGVYADGVTDLIVKNCKIFDNDGGVWDGNSGGVFLGYLWVMDNGRAGVVACTVSACSISNNKQYHARQWNSSGIHAYGTKNSLFEKNVIFDQYNGIRLKHVDTSNVIRNNIFFDCNNGISVCTPTYDTKIYGNIVHHSGTGIFLDLDRVAYGPPWNTKLVKIYNNTIYNLTNIGIDMTGDYGDTSYHHDGDTLYNNIIINAGTSTYGELNIYENNHRNLNEDYNDFYDTGNNQVVYYHGSKYTLPGYVSASPYSDHSINSNPLFVDPPTSAYDSTYDFRLQSNSPVKGKGMGGVDMGAYPAPNTPPPSPPPNSPTSGETVVGSKPILVVNNVSDPDGPNSITLTFEVAQDSNFSNIADDTIGVLQSQTFPNTSWKLAQALNDSTWYWWRARAFDGLNYSSWSVKVPFFVITYGSGVDDSSTVDSSLVKTEINFSPTPFDPFLNQVGVFHNLPADAEVKIISISGELVRKLRSDSRGELSWDGTNQNSEKAAPGVYLYFVNGLSSDNFKIVIMH
jgi:parallel beta-helix repeat protein